MKLHEVPGAPNSKLAVIFQNTHPLFASRVKQSTDAAESARGALRTTLGVLDAKIGRHTFAAGDKPTIADCTLLASLQFAEFAQIPIDPAHDNIHRWYASLQQRPSAAA